MKNLLILCLLIISSYCFILRAEAKAYRTALLQSDAGFIELMQMSVRGKKLYEYINPHSVGTFNIRGESYACAILHTPIPDLPK